MKKILFVAIALSGCAVLTSCELDKFPETGYSEQNYLGGSDNTDEQYTTREDMLGQRDAIYSDVRSNIQECGYLDLLAITECRTDNAYGGSTSTGELMALEANSQDCENKNVVRDWSYYLARISQANQVICFIDDIKEKDASMTQTEHDEWKSEALCWRAYNLFNMVRLWGDIPMLTVVPPAITADNIDEVYYQYFPKRSPVEDIYAQIIEDLEYAAKYGPMPDASNKFVFSKGFANGMLARVYLEKPVLDYDKVIEYCNAVEALGYSLCENYGDLFAYTDGDSGDSTRNTSESIFEVTYSKSSGQWVWMMFHRNAYNPDDSFSWAKWITPSRNLAEAYDAEGDTERKNASIIYDACSWSLLYPSDSYAFMHKLPTNATSIIVMRLAEIYLMHAEALAMKGLLPDAAEYVNKVRRRAKLSDLSASATASSETMLDAILKERRLELAFEGFRWFDLVRTDKIKEVHDGVNVPGSASYDPYFSTRYPLTEESILLPIPTTAIDTNPSLTQNPGY